MGKHTIDQSPATLAYDVARARVGEWVVGDRYNGRPKIPFPCMKAAAEAALVAQFGQHPIQAAHTVESAFMSVSDQLRLEQHIG